MTETWIACVKIIQFKRQERERPSEGLERGNEKSPNVRRAGELDLERMEGQLGKRKVF